MRRRRDPRSADTWAGSSRTRRISSRVSAGHQSGQYCARPTRAASISMASCRPRRRCRPAAATRTASRLAPIAKPMRASCAAQQVRRGRARVIGAVAQVGGRHGLGLRPCRDVRAAHPLALVVPGHAAILAAVDIHVTGIQVDGDRAIGQRRRPQHGHQLETHAPLCGRSHPEETAPRQIG